MLFLVRPGLLADDITQLHHYIVGEMSVNASILQLYRNQSLKDSMLISENVNIHEHIDDVTAGSDTTSWPVCAYKCTEFLAFSQVGLS